MAMEKLKQKRWPKIVLYLIILAGLSFGLMYLLEYLMAYFNVSVERYASTAYLLVFGITLASNASILVPVALHISIMIAAATYFDPVLIALTASVAGALGEISAYYAGRWGRKRIVQLENTPGYEKLVGWMERHGSLGIFLISLQPIFPIDVAGLLAGISKMPLWKFFLPCLAGKFPKYLVVCYIGEPLLDMLRRLLPLPPL
ncbi:MAG: VTT domain-containing protein [Chloroflexota bacterium]